MGVSEWTVASVVGELPGPAYLLQDSEVTGSLRNLASDFVKVIYSSLFSVLLLCLLSPTHTHALQLI